MKFKLLFFLSIVYVFGSKLNAQESDTLTTRKDAPNLYFDCQVCFLPFYKQNLSYVNFVRDRRMADIYLLITLNSTGSKGTLYKLFLIGENKFKGQNDTLEFEAPANMAEAEIRGGILGQLKIGLLPFLVQTKMRKNISYTVELPEENLNASKVRDKWNFWTFNLTADVSGDGNSYAKSLNMNYFFSANRTTEKLRTETGGWYNLNRQEFKIDDSTTVKGLQNVSGLYHFLSFSLGEHFGVGQFATYFNSTQQNLKNSTSWYPGIEYNVFPYKDASRRQFRLIYRLGLRYQDYAEKTIYNKMHELYGLHSFVLQFTQIEKWGSVNVSAGGWHYLNYAKNYSASVYPSINFNPARGLRIGLWGGFQIVKDQFFLRASEASAAEILLNQVNLKTDYSYEFGCSIGYTFGTRYNSIINVRFDLNDNYW